MTQLEDTAPAFGPLRQGAIRGPVRRLPNKKLHPTALRATGEFQVVRRRVEALWPHDTENNQCL